jgi:ribonucleotide reductase beta subunit family protein with ferritin-like domain
MIQERLREPLLTEDNSRFTQLPVKYTKLQNAYDIAEGMFWTAKEIDYAADLNDWESLNDNEKYFIEHILAFFAGADGIVLENLITNFCVEVKAPEARNFYAFQGMIENIHAMTYSLLIETFIKDVKRKQYLFNAIDNIPCVAKKANWALKWLNNERPFEERVIAFAVVEGIFFSGAFCSIFWLKNRNKMTKALGKSNELISRDEGMHTEFAVLIYEHLANKVTQERVEEIFKEAVEIEEEFICESLPCKLIGMNSDLMREYIKYVADRLLVQLGFNKIYMCTNPFDFMVNINLDGKTNFFEQKISEYVHSSILAPKEDSWNFDENVEF